MIKVMIDLDETIVSGGYLEALNDYLKTDYKQDDVKEYYVSDILSPEENDKYLTHFYKNVNVYDHAHVIPNAIEVIKELNEVYDLYICTAFYDKRKPKECITMSKNKYDWILENLPFINPRHILLTSAKELIMCDVKIDDKVSNLKRGYGKIKLLLTAFHNKDYTKEELASYGILRVDNWLEIKKILLEGELPK